MTTAELARRVRLDVLRMTSRSGASHVGSGFSIADILAVLYGAPLLRYRSGEPKWPGRDRFILSKGHAGAAVYSVLAHSGFFPVTRLETHCGDGSDLCGHVSHKGIAGVEVSTGSLGFGLGLAAGMATALKHAGSDSKVVALMSDGECDEGSTWEAALYAAHNGLSNLVAIVDYNKIQSLASVETTLALEPFTAKWAAFNWDVSEVDGHDHDQIASAFSSLSGSKPHIILAHTVKGRGVSFMENSVLWHYRAARGEEFEAALRELEAHSPDA